MNIKTVNSLALSLFLLTACNSKKESLKPNIENNITTNKKTLILHHIPQNEPNKTPPTSIAQPHISPLIIDQAYTTPSVESNNAQSERINDVGFIHPRDRRRDQIVSESIDDVGFIHPRDRRRNQIEQEEPSTHSYNSELTGDFENNYKLLSFIERLNSEQGFEKSYLMNIFSEAKNTKYFPIDPPRRRSQPTGLGQWDRYKSMFVYERNIQRGIDFWGKHANTLNRAYQEYGVLPEYIIGIIGIETAYGVNFGKKRVIDVLTTRAMTGDRREGFYTKQLEKFLIMTRKANLQPTELMGSNAGAMGYGQFIPSSYLEFAVDFNGDGITDLWNAEDAIGSIANYFSRNGWRRSLKTVAVRAKYPGSRFRRLKTGYKTKYSQYTLRRKYKITPRKKLHFNGEVSLIKLPKGSYDELWMGTHNFRVITTYNHSDLYGMAVHTLAKKVKARRYN